MPPAVTVESLSKRYGPVQAVDSVTFEVAEGEIFGLLGPNGAGKTTTVECLVGLQSPDAGVVRIQGVIAPSPRDRARAMGVALQDTMLPEKLRVREALDLFSVLYGRHADPEPLLTRFGLTGRAEATFDSLSGGERQRVALALAFVNDPAILVLDEPAAGLDPQGQADLKGHLSAIKREGRSILLTTHDLHDAEALCDRVAIMVNGRIAAIGAPSALQSEAAGEQTLHVEASAPLDADAVRALPGVIGVSCEGRSATLRVTSSGAAIEALIAWMKRNDVDLVDLRIERTSLEDAFHRVTRGQTS